MQNVMGALVAQPVDSYESWKGIPGEWVEAPNERRGGASGVQRLYRTDGSVLYRKQQVNHRCYNWRHPLGEPTIMREQRALRACEELGLTVPEVVFCGMRRQAEGEEALLVTRALVGYESLESLCARGALDDSGRRAQVLQRLGQSLARLHRARWQHGCLYPKHVFVALDKDGDARIALLDLEKSRQRLTRRAAARHDFRQLRRHANFAPLDWALIEAGYRQETGEPFEG